MKGANQFPNNVQSRKTETRVSLESSHPHVMAMDTMACNAATPLLFAFLESAKGKPRRHAMVAAREKLRSDTTVITVDARQRLKARRRPCIDLLPRRRRASIHTQPTKQEAAEVNMAYRWVSNYLLEINYLRTICLVRANKKNSIAPAA
jgi:hypothetical protein